MSDAAIQRDGAGFLDDWMSELREALDRLRDLAPDLVPESFSHDSLGVLEEELIDAFVGETAEPDLIITVAAYLGETLMHTAGGHWD
ncbi:hypothetical protein [Streptomyces sp. KR80]|uniref:hypothetical protein n=1 Tax=Streptomyces sp. KR80 TaxID=3457426 RepID=UPI003FD1A2C8